VIGQQIAEQLPQIVGEAAKAFGNIGQLTVLNGAEGIGQLFSQVLGMGATAIPMLRGLLDQTTNGGGHRTAGETKESAKRSD
jgi:flotillin